MTAILLALAVVQVAGLFVLLVAIRRAPIAIESESGFHVIAEPASERADLPAALAKTA